MDLQQKIAKRFLNDISDNALKQDFSFLQGEHILTGVQSDKIDNQSEYRDYKNCSAFSFILDGITFTAVEDPEDGWRSTLNDIFIEMIEVKNTFDPVIVSVEMIDKDDFKGIHISYKGQAVLAAGTDYSDSWYPCYVASWDAQLFTQLLQDN